MQYIPLSVFKETWKFEGEKKVEDKPIKKEDEKDSNNGVNKSEGQ